MNLANFGLMFANTCPAFFPNFVPSISNEDVMNINNNKILITGGASGIGLGLTERFVKENNTVLICGRREDALKEVSDKFPSVIRRVCDLSLPEEREALYQWISDEHSDLNVLVNNAGIQQWMSVSDDDFFQRAKNELTVNIEAPLHLILCHGRCILRHKYPLKIQSSRSSQV